MILVRFDDVIKGGLVIVFSKFFEGGEIVFDRVQVRGIRRQKEQRSCAMNERVGFRALVASESSDAKK